MICRRYQEQSSPEYKYLYRPFSRFAFHVIYPIRYQQFRPFLFLPKSSSSIKDVYHQCGISLFRHHITTVFYYIVYAVMNMKTIGNFVDISWAIRKPIFVSKISISKTLNVLVQSNIISFFHTFDSLPNSIYFKRRRKLNVYFSLEFCKKNTVECASILRIWFESSGH